MGNGGTCQLWPTPTDPRPWRWPRALAGWTGTAHREGCAPAWLRSENQSAQLSETNLSRQQDYGEVERDAPAGTPHASMTNTENHPNRKRLSLFSCCTNLQFYGWKYHLDVVVVEMYFIYISFSLLRKTANDHFTWLVKTIVLLVIAGMSWVLSSWFSAFLHWSS